MKRQGYWAVSVMVFFLACGGVSTVQATDTQAVQAQVQKEEYELPWMSLHMGTIISVRFERRGSPEASSDGRRRNRSL